jgi:hypothetical protein
MATSQRQLAYLKWRRQPAGVERNNENGAASSQRSINEKYGGGGMASKIMLSGGVMA